MSAIAKQIASIYITLLEKEGMTAHLQPFLLKSEPREILYMRAIVPIVKKVL